MEKKIIIVGAGLAGSLCALYMLQRGYNVTVYERRSDMRKSVITAGRSINLALSKRGWTALKKVGIEDRVMEISIPMPKRIMHDLEGSLQISIMVMKTKPFILFQGVNLMFC
jgi:kynurenine 3-monooxygenase